MGKFQPLFDWVVVEQIDLLEENKSAGGILLLTHNFDLYQFDDIDKKIDDIVKNSKQNVGIIKRAGNKCNFVKEGDRVIYKGHTEHSEIKIDGEDCVMVKEENVLVKIGEKLNIRPGYIIVKISKESRDALIVKKGIRDDGSEYEMFVTMPPMPDEDRHSQYFISGGVIMAVGKGVSTAQVGDFALINYLCDNDETVIVGYDGEDKLIAVNATTSRHETAEIIHANRRNRRDQMVYDEGDYKNTSDLLGVVRGEELISIDPFVFLVHKSTMVEKETASGIQYVVDEKIIRREVLAVSPETESRFGIQKGEIIVMDDFDSFDVVFEGRTISAVNDVDIMGRA